MASVNPSLDNTYDDPSKRTPLVLGELDYGGVTDTVSKIWEAEKQPKIWYIVLGLALSLLLVLGGCLNHLILKGVGVWGNNNPAYWGWPIVNFVFWVGIGHAGTLISAILFLFRQNWRTSINRAAEAMTIFAVVCAGLFPGVHIGRVWSFYWLFPIPTEHLAMWPNFRSPLLWDVFAVSTYATVSALFWYMGMVPDIATFRDRCKSKIGKVIYGCCHWVGQVHAELGTATRLLIRSWLPWRRHWFCRCTRSLVLTLRFRRSPVGTRRFSHLTLLQVRFSPALRWWSRCWFRFAKSTA